MCYFSRLTAASRQELTLRNCLRAQGPTQLRLCAAGLNGGLRGPAQVTGGAVREKGQRLGDHELRRRARDSLPGNGRRRAFQVRLGPGLGVSLVRNARTALPTLASDEPAHLENILRVGAARRPSVFPPTSITSN